MLFEIEGMKKVNLADTAFRKYCDQYRYQKQSPLIGFNLKKNGGDDFTSPSEMELNVEWHVEDPHEVDCHQNEP